MGLRLRLTLDDKKKRIKHWIPKAHEPDDLLILLLLTIVTTVSANIEIKNRFDISTIFEKIINITNHYLVVL